MSHGNGKGDLVRVDQLRAGQRPGEGVLGGQGPQDRDTYTEEVRELIKAHERGKVVVVEEAPAARTADVVDLMSALEARLEAARSRKDREKALSDAADRLFEEAEGQRERRGWQRVGKAANSEEDRHEAACGEAGRKVVHAADLRAQEYVTPHAAPNP